MTLCFEGIRSDELDRQRNRSGLFHGRLILSTRALPESPVNPYGRHTTLADASPTISAGPYEEGLNNVDGFSAWTTVGRLLPM